MSSAAVREMETSRYPSVSAGMRVSVIYSRAGIPARTHATPRFNGPLLGIPRRLSVVSTALPLIIVRDWTEVQLIILCCFCFWPSNELHFNDEPKNGWHPFNKTPKASSLGFEQCTLGEGRNVALAVQNPNTGGFSIVALETVNVNEQSQPWQKWMNICVTAPLERGIK